MTKRKFNRQRVFNQIVEHLFKQGGPATRPGGIACVYRTNPRQPERSKRACGIGGLMTDEAYRGSDLQRSEMRGESFGVDSVEVLSLLGFSNLGRDDRQFLADAQWGLHDRILPDASSKTGDRYFMRQLPEAVMTFASFYGLKVPKIVPKTPPAADPPAR